MAAAEEKWRARVQKGRDMAKDAPEEMPEEIPKEIRAHVYAAARQASAPYFNSRLQPTRDQYAQCVKDKGADNCSSIADDLKSQVEALSEKTNDCSGTFQAYVAVVTMARDDPAPFERAWIHCMESED